MAKPTNTFTQIPQSMLAWFDQHKRTLPWRQARTPYRVWLAEVMLQQTTVAAVIGYYQRFLAAFPTIEALAEANLEDVLKLWQGLGYYSRAKNLHKCAQTIIAEYQGQFPTSAAKLAKLPGVGPYTAAAVAAIAFNENAVVVDANIERVLSRIFAIQTPLPDSKPQIYAYAKELTPQNRNGDYAEALMDLGATICTPKAPKCQLCPIRAFCKATQSGIAAELPKKKPKAIRPQKTGIAYCITNKSGAIFLQKRPEKGLLSGLWEIPHQGWEGTLLPNFIPPLSLKDAQKYGAIKHVFTHFSLTLDVRHIALNTCPHTNNGIWAHPKELENYPLSTLMRKALDVFLEG